LKREIHTDVQLRSRGRITTARRRPRPSYNLNVPSKRSSMHFTKSQHRHDAFRISGYIDFTLDSQNDCGFIRLRSAALFFELTTFLFSCQSFSDI